MTSVVRPRVLSPHTGEKLYLDDALEPLIEAGGPGPVCVYGPPGSGKSTALAWLAGRFPSLAILDVPRQEEVAGLAEGQFFVYSASSPFAVEHLTTFELTPWGEDEVLDYLLSTAKDRCGSILERLRETPEAERPAWPELWRICLDVMVEDGAVSTPREGLRRALDRVMAPESRARARMICLEQWGRASEVHQSRWLNRDYLAWVLGVGNDPPGIRFLRFSSVRLMLAAERLIEILSKEEPVQFPLWAPDGAFVREAGVACADSPQSLERLRELADGREGTSWSASLLVAAKADWRPKACGGWDLRSAVLEGAAWGDVNLHDARLEHADFSRAHLQGAVLDAARLYGAVFREADLSGASLGSTGARGIDLACANLSRVVGSGADFSDGNLIGANFREARLPGALFTGTKLDRACFESAALRNADFRGANAGETDFRCADLSGADLSGVDLRRALLGGATFVRATLQDCNLEKARLDEADFQGAVLVGAHLSGSSLPRANLQEARLEKAQLADVHWEGADLREADLRHCTFHLGTSRSGLVFGEPMQGSRTGFYVDAVRDRAWRPVEEIRAADLRGVDLRGARLEGTDFYQVDLRGAKLDPGQREALRAAGAILDD